MNAKPLSEYWEEERTFFQPVVPFHPKTDRLERLDLSVSNKDLTEDIYTDLDKFSAYIFQRLCRSGARYLVGGYGELRKIYGASKLFDGNEPRRLHLGVDVWGPAGTEVFAPTRGRIHSVAWNGSRGDYGGTVILRHETPEITWHTLYGHLSKASLAKKTGVVAPGDLIGTLGDSAENGWWPPHLHFQVILDMQGLMGDYPGVCKASEKETYLANCPDPERLLGFL